MKKHYFVIAAALFSMQLSAKDYFVKAGASGNGESWSTATELQDAISKCVDNDVIHIAAGTYVPTALPDETVTDPRSATFAITKNVTLIGGYPANASQGAASDPIANETLLSGNDDLYHIVCVSTKSCGTTDKVVLRGLSLSGGKAVLNPAEEGKTPPDRVTINEGPFLFNRGASFISFNSNVELDNCVIMNSKGTNTGSCFYVHKEHNAGDGIVTIKDCIFDNNNSSNSVAYIWGRSKVTIENCEFTGNVSAAETAGVGFGGGADALVVDCKFINNKAKNGGAMLVRDSKAVIENSLFSKNLATDATLGAGCIMFENSNVDVNNTIFTENQCYTAPAAGVYKKSIVNFNKCTFEKGNINDPKLTEQTTNGAPYYKASAVQVANEGSIGNFNECVFSANFTRTDGTVCIKEKGKAYFVNCLFENNKSIVESAVARAQDEGSYAFFDGCTVKGNILTTQVGNRYNAQHVLAASKAKIDIYNSLFDGNMSVDKSGAAIGVRSAGTVNVINTTCINNGGKDIIFMWDAGCTGNIISSTIVDNSPTGAPVMNTQGGVVVKSYNTIYSNNMKGTEDATPSTSVKNCIMGIKYRDAEGAEIAGILDFDRSYDLAEVLADNGGPVMTLKLDPDADKTTLALTKGMTADELGALATTLGLDVEKVKRDARGAIRKGANIGAYTEGVVSGFEDISVKEEVFTAFVSNNVICVKALQSMRIDIYNINGVKVLTKDLTEGYNMFPEITSKGNYILRGEGCVLKVLY